MKTFFFGWKNFIFPWKYFFQMKWLYSHTTRAGRSEGKIFSSEKKNFSFGNKNLFLIEKFLFSNERIFFFGYEDFIFPWKYFFFERKDSRSRECCNIKVHGREIRSIQRCVWGSTPRLENSWEWENLCTYSKVEVWSLKLCHPPCLLHV